MYNITFLGDIVLAGTIQLMSFHTLLTTNCWSNAVFEYSFNTSSAYFQINVEPNDCAIAKNVKVELRFMGG